MNKISLYEGPICRHPLKQDEYHVAYNLEEASRLFQSIKGLIDWSSVKLIPPPDVNSIQNLDQELIHRDEVYARQLQAQLNRENTNQAQQRTQVSRENRTVPIPQRTADVAALVMNQPSGHLKNCNHRCDLVSTRQCCTCSGKVYRTKIFF